MSLFKNKYRTESCRMKNWNYGWNAPYFITVLNKKTHRFFGNIQRSEMILSDIGKIVEKEWLKTPEIRPDMNLELGEWVIMPNHFHAIISIGKNEFNIGKPPESPTKQNRFTPQSKNLGSIVRGFKSTVTKQARKINPNFGWQSGYYCIIIFNFKSYNNISNYIKQNPLNWKNDKFNK